MLPLVQIADARQSDKKMTNSDVVSLMAAGLSDDIIIAKIDSATALDFDTSTDGLKALKSAHVSNAVIRTMVVHQTELKDSPPPAAAATTNLSNNPEDTHPPGIYLYAVSASGHALTELNRATPKQYKSNGVLLSGLTYGIKKAKMVGVLDGANAVVKTSDASPVFYLYITEDTTTFGGSYLTPQAFSLVQLTPKDSTREIVESSDSIRGLKYGIDDQSRHSFDTTRIKAGVYKLTSAHPLAPGEYAFAQNMGMFFDFRIVSPQ